MFVLLWSPGAALVTGLPPSCPAPGPDPAHQPDGDHRISVPLATKAVGDKGPPVFFKESGHEVRRCSRTCFRGFSDDAELLEIIRSHSRDSEQRQAACQVLVSRYQWLVRACVQPYRAGPEREDLMQVGYLGLLKAINSFDPEVGSSLAAYARPCIGGEIKRHFRDKRWQVRVRRSVQELRLEMRSATAELTQCLQRNPLDTEIADFMKVSVKDVEEAHLADTAYFPVSIDAMRSSGSDASTADLADFLGAEDPQLDHLLGVESVSAHWAGLPADQQRVLLLIFYSNMTQKDVGKRLGVSQMQVSRLRARALEYLRTAILNGQ